MKKFVLTLCAVMAILFTGCRYDDSDLWNSVNDLDRRVTSLEEMCLRMNTNIMSLQTLVDAMQDNDYITGVNYLYEGDTHVGYTIDFAKSESINIYHGKDGKNGIDGNNGTNGTNGKDGSDGYTPTVGLAQDSDGHYYWTLDGEWLLDSNGQKVSAEGKPGKDGKDGQNGADGQNGTNGKDGADGKDGVDGKDGQNGTNGTYGKDGVDGKDGITPQFKIEDGDWYISLDNCLSWDYLGRATGADGKDGVDGKDGQNGADGKDGEDGKDGQNGADGKDGKDGDSMFSNIDTSNDEYVIFTLSNGTQIKLPTWYAFTELKQLCNQMNTNIRSLQTIVEAMQQNDYIVSCTPLMEDGKPVGYTITFAQSGSIVIYHGKNGADGKDGQNGTNGTNGKDGVDGKDGHTPVIGVKEDGGILYWTLDGEFMKDEKGQKIPVTGKDGKDGQNGADGKDGTNGKDGADGKDGTNGTNGTNGKDGITPKLKIDEEDGTWYWYVSYNDGSDWEKLGRATGADGKDGANGKDGTDGKDGVDGKNGDSIFKSVTEDDYYIHLTLTDGERTIDIPKNKPFAISFDSEEFTVQPGQTYSLHYTITGGDAHTKITIYEKNGLKAKINKTSNTEGILEVTTPAGMTPASIHELIVMVNDGNDRTLMETLIFVKGVAKVTNYSTIVNSNETEVTVTLKTNLYHYKVVIPEEEQSWLSISPDTRAKIRNDEIKFTFETNDSNSSRSAIVSIVDEAGMEVETLYVYQHGIIAKQIYNETEGQLSKKIDSNEKDKLAYLFISGNLNTSDFSFIKEMTNLKYVDLSATNNTSIPGPPGTSVKSYFNGNYEVLILPTNITSIPGWCFYECTNLKNIKLPESLLTIGEKSFYGCTSLIGDLIIPDNVTYIGSSAFSNCTGLNQNLIIGSKVNSIRDYAFAGDSFKKIYNKSLTAQAIVGVNTTAFTVHQIYLGVPKGSINSYLNNSYWASLVYTIEEVDFEELGY